MVVLNNGSGVEQVVNDPSATKVIDRRTGIQAMRGSQQVGDGFISSVLAAYSNLVYHPIALVMLLFGIFILLAEINNTDGPIEIIVERLVHYIAGNHPQWLKNLAMVLMYFFAAAVKYKALLASMCLLWFTAVSKPSTRTLIVTLILSIVVIYMRHMSVLDILVISQLFYLFCNVRTPSFKLIIAVVAIAMFFSGTVSLDEIAAKNPYMKTMSDVKIETLIETDMIAYENKQKTFKLKPDPVQKPVASKILSNMTGRA